MGSGAARRTTGWRIAAVVATVAWLLLLGWLIATALAPSLRETAPVWLAGLAQPDSAAAMTLAVLLAVASMGLLLATRPSADVRVPFIISVGCAIAAGGLGLAAYLPCPGTRPPGWDALANTLGLFLGGFELPFGPGEACTYPAPLALHLARLLAIVATLSGALSVLLSVSRSQLDRLGVLRARTVDLVMGLDDASWPVAAELAGSAGPGHRCVLLADGADLPMEARARAAGMLVLRSEPSDPLALDSGTLWARVRRVHLLSADAALNRSRADLLSAAVGRQGRPPAPGLRVIARIDDPWHADDWRKSHIGDQHLVVDAIGTYEATAASLVERLRAMPSLTRLLVVGDSTLALATCAELSQRAREDEFTGSGTGVRRVTLVGRLAGATLADHRLRQHRFAVDPLELDAAELEPDLDHVEALVRAADAGVAVVVTLPGTRLGGRLGVRFPDLPVFEVSTRADVPADARPVVGRVTPFSLTLGGASSGSDAWERAARAVHARYCRRFPDSPLAVPWEALPREFYRESNRRQLRTVLDGVAALGRSWRPTSPEDVTFDPARMASDDDAVRIEEGRHLFDLDTDELEALARAEHASWLAHYRADGWTQGEQRDDDARRHPLLREWDDLPAGARQRTRVGVVDTLFQLRALGYRPVRHGAEAWARYERIGTVAAERLDAPVAWTAPTGERLTAAAGDWLVTDASGGRRSVTDTSFRATHEQLPDGSWRRTGTVRARLARQGESVETQEGTTTAGEGSWLVEDANGNRWLVPPDHFAVGYRRVG